jgi:hypothetical protein
MEKEFADIVDPRSIENEYTQIVPFTACYRKSILPGLSGIRGQDEYQDENDREG